MKKIYDSKNDIIVNLASRQYLNNIPYMNRQKWFDEINLEVANILLDLSIKKKAFGYIFLVHGGKLT